MISPSDPCIEWKGTLDRKGYGVIWDRLTKRPRRAHRVLYVLSTGKPIPDGLDLDHLCSHPACVHPGHLEPVTTAENNRRTAARGRMASSQRTHCPAGHPYDRVEPSSGARRCSICRKASGRRYIQANREAVRERSNAFYAQNRDAITARRRAQYQARLQWPSDEDD